MLCRFERCPQGGSSQYSAPAEQLEPCHRGVGLCLKTKGTAHQPCVPCREANSFTIEKKKRNESQNPFGTDYYVEGCRQYLYAVIASSIMAFGAHAPVVVEEIDV